MDLFCSLKSCFYGGISFVFQPGIYMDRWDLPKTAPDLVNLGPQSTVCNLHPDIWSHHPVLDSHVQITRKYSTAMCSMCSCSDQRSQNNLLWSMKGVESLRMQSFKGFWKSRKIPGLDFWESRDRDFEKIPGSRDIPGSRLPMWDVRSRFEADFNRAIYQ